MDDDDDYWNTSETKAKALSFDDDILSTQEILAIGQRSIPSSQSTSDVFSISNVKTPLLPVSSLVKPSVLDLILLAQLGEDPPNIQPKTHGPERSVPATLKRLVLGRSCSLHGHRSLRTKTELLDGAVAIGDGNAILSVRAVYALVKTHGPKKSVPATLNGHRSLRMMTKLLDGAVTIGDGSAILNVVLFLIQTLNKKLVYELLSSRPLALNHYISFLQNEGRIGELTDLLTMLGRSPEAAMYQYQHHVKTQGSSVDGLLRKMTNLLSNHFQQPGVDVHQAKILTCYIKFLEWQKCVDKPELLNRSAIHCLAYCCAHHWSEGAGKMMSPLTLCQQQQITPLQYDWVVLNVHANLKNWDIIESVFTRKDWLGRSTVSSHIPLQTVIAKLSERSASKELLATFINKVSSAEERLQLATQFKVHTVVIETYAKQKDRNALNNYKMTLNPQSEEYILAENTLRDTSIKWRN